MNSVRRLVFLFVTISHLGYLHADLAPGPSECDTQADGERCVLFDGTAGLCKSHEGRGRKWHTCEKDDKECDRLQVGAPCHGYLRKPARCQAFTLDNRSWRACVVDETPASATAPQPSSPDAQSRATWPVGGLVGALVGGVAFVALARALNWRRRRKERDKKASLWPPP